MRSAMMRRFCIGMSGVVVLVAFSVAVFYIHWLWNSKAILHQERDAALVERDNSAREAEAAEKRATHLQEKLDEATKKASKSETELTNLRTAAAAAAGPPPAQFCSGSSSSTDPPPQTRQQLPEAGLPPFWLPKYCWLDQKKIKQLEDRKGELEKEVEDLRTQNAVLSLRIALGLPLTSPLYMSGQVRSSPADASSDTQEGF